ncbi:helix-turn-helix transcriptional regulator [Leucobacter sp. GX24907]
MHERRTGEEVLTAIELKDTNLSDPWTAEFLAREVALSPSQLSSLFRAQLGASPAAYLRKIRADRMADPLATTSLTAGEGGAAVGWQDPTFASRSFKHRYGIAPSTFARVYREC